MRISVVEDNPAVLGMIETALALRGHVVEKYGNARSFFLALQRSKSTPPCDLVIVDLFLDRSQSGTEILDALSITQPQTIPTILMSAAEENAFVPIRNRYPNLPILQKPFKIQTLISLVDEATSSIGA